MDSVADTAKSGGLPHSEIHGSKGAHPSPRLFAACHVLHRLCMPRHPPNALKSLENHHEPENNNQTRSPSPTPRRHTQHPRPIAHPNTERPKPPAQRRTTNAKTHSLCQRSGIRHRASVIRPTLRRMTQTMFPYPGCPRQRPKNGGARRDRTDDLLLAKQALSQLSYGPALAHHWLGSRSPEPRSM